MGKKKEVLTVWVRQWRSCIENFKHDLKTADESVYATFELWRTKKAMVAETLSEPKHLRITIEEL